MGEVAGVVLGEHEGEGVPARQAAGASMAMAMETSVASVAQLATLQTAARWRSSCDLPFCACGTASHTASAAKRQTAAKWQSLSNGSPALLGAMV